MKSKIFKQKNSSFCWWRSCFFYFCSNTIRKENNWTRKRGGDECNRERSECLSVEYVFGMFTWVCWMSDNDRAIVWLELLLERREIIQQRAFRECNRERSECLGAEHVFGMLTWVCECEMIHLLCSLSSLSSLLYYSIQSASHFKLCYFFSSFSFLFFWKWFFVFPLFLSWLAWLVCLVSILQPL